MLQKSQYFDNTHYKKLIKLALTHQNNDKVILEQLTKHFNVPLTPRSRARVNSLAAYILHLERLDILSECNVDVLLWLAEYTKNDVLRQEIEQYKPFPVTFKSNQYALNRLDKIQSSPTLSTNSSSTIKPIQQTVTINANKVQQLHKMLAQEIGRHWRRLARELNISEVIMDEIEIKYPRDLYSCAYQVLQKAQNAATNDLPMHIRILSQALDNCQRKDLRRRISTILSSS